MMAPKYERARVLAEALEVGVRELEDPIDNVTVSGDRISIVAGRKRLELLYTYHNAYSQNGSVMPGSGHWSVSIKSSHKENSFGALVRAIWRKGTLFRGPMQR
jgi:hypothetical protein